MALGNNLKNSEEATVVNSKATTSESKKDTGLTKEIQAELDKIKQELDLKNEVLDDTCLISITDKKGHITYVNDYFVELAKYDRDELIGKNHNIVRHPDMPKEVFKEVWSTIGRGDTFRGYIKNRAKDGSHYWVDATIRPIGLDSKGKPEGYIGVRFDITDLMESRDNEQAYNEAINMGWAFVEFEPDGTIKTANKNFLSSLGYSSNDDIVGKHHSIFCESSYVSTSEYKDFWDDLGNGKVKSGEFKRISKTGNEVFINASYTPVTDQNGKVVKVIKIANDITQMVQDRANANAVKTAVDTAWASIEFQPDGTILSANANFVKTLGYATESDIVGKHHRIFCDNEYQRSAEYKQFWTDLSNGIPKQGEFMRMSKNGEEVWIQACYSPVEDASGRVYKVIKIATDITEHKNVIKDISRVVALANEDGDLSARLDTSQAEGDYKILGDSINSLLNTISEPIYEIKELVKGLAQGNLSEQFSLAVNGDFRELGDSYNEAQQNLNDLLGNINEIANLISVSSEELLTKADQMQGSTQESASAIQQMAEGAQEQAMQTDEVSKLVENVLNVANNTAEKSDFINKAAEMGQKSANEGLITIRKVVENMLEIQTSAGVTSKSIDILTDRSEEIARTLNVITDIAAQTNLLALNAAIEAARAGDAGRGFAVVAEEIRKLAEDSRKSATDIERVITDVQKDISSASKAIDSMDTSVKSGNQASKEAEEVFQNIEKSTSETFSLSKEILTASGEQRSAINETVKNIEKIVVVSEETAAGTEQIATSSKNMSLGMQEVTATSKDLAGVAIQLQDGVSKFKLRKV